MTRSSQSWRDPLLVLDAAAGVPPAVGTPATEFTAFTQGALTLLDVLSSTLMRPERLSEELTGLAELAHAHASTLPASVPTADESASASNEQSSGLRHQELEERIRYDEFFGIRRRSGIPAEEFAHTIFATFALMARDLAVTQLGLHELIALLRGFVHTTAWIGKTGGTGAAQSLIAPASSPMARFRLGHLGFAVFCNFATYELMRALNSDGVDPLPFANAATCIRASTASMWYSVSFARQAYAQDVRPLMDAASTETHGFSGLDNFDFRRMREAWEQLGTQVASQVGRPATEVRDAAHRLFETIVEDGEHHILIAAELVGILPSLKYERIAARSGVSGIPAVAALRLNAEERQLMLAAIAGE